MSIKEATFSRSGNTQLLYGSLAKACCMVSIAPSMSASFMRVTSIGIVKASRLLRWLGTPGSLIYHDGNKGQVICTSIETGKRRDSAMIGAGRFVNLVACNMWIGDEMGRSKRRSRALRGFCLMLSEQVHTNHLLQSHLQLAWPHYATSAW